MTSSSRVHRSAYIGLFTITLTTLMYENLLTRIFSVTMWYHFAFMAVSIALFGMTVGAILVYLFPDRFSQRRITEHLSVTALLFAISIVASFWIHLNIPLSQQASPPLLLLNYAIISIPFVLAHSSQRWISLTSPLSISVRCTVAFLFLQILHIITNTSRLSFW